MDPEEVKEKFKKFCEKLGGQISKERQFDYDEREWADVTACTLPEPKELLFMNSGGRVRLDFQLPLSGSRSLFNPVVKKSGGF